MARFFEDYEYEMVPKENGKGTKRKLVYVGDHYTLTDPEARVKKYRGLFLLNSLLGSGLHLFSVLQDVPSNVGGLVGVPAGLALLPLIAVVYGSLVGLTVKVGVPMEKGKYQETALCRRIGSSVAILLLAYCAIALVIYTALNRESVPVGQELLIAGGYVITALLMVACYRMEKGLTYQVIPGKGKALSEKKN